MPDSTDDTDKTENGNEEGDTGKQMSKLRWVLNNFFVGKEVVWTAIFTGALVVFTFKLYQVSDMQNAIAVSSQRGFLTFAGPNLGARLIDNGGSWKGYEIAIIWVNSGNTPTRDVVIQNNASAFFPDIPEAYSFPLALPKIKAVIGPKANYGTNITVDKDVISDYWQHKKRIFIWGTAAYKDGFQDTPDRLSEFCVELTHLTINQQEGFKSPEQVDVTKPSVVLTGFQWQQCSEHNCYDEDCKDYSARIKDMRTP